MEAKEFTVKLCDGKAPPWQSLDHLFMLDVRIDALLASTYVVSAFDYHFRNYDSTVIREILISQLMEFFESEIRKAIERDYGPNALGKTSDIPEQCPPGPPEKTG